MRKIGLGLLVLAFLIPTLAFAQAVPAVSLTDSPTSVVTNSLYGGPADHYLNVFDFNQITSPLFMLAITPGAYNTTTTTGTTTDLAQAGFATWFDTLYTALYYGFDGKTVGTLGVSGKDSTVQTQNDTLIYDPSTLVAIGKTSTITKQVDYNVALVQNPAFLVGFKLDNILLGFYNNLRFANSDHFGTFDNTYTSVANSRKEVRNTTGVVSTVTNDEYGLGSNLNDQVIEDFVAGLSLPIDKATLQASVGFNLTTGTRDSQTAPTIFTQNYEREQLWTQANAGYAAYTPAVGLEGVAGTAINDVQKYQYDAKTEAFNVIAITPSLKGQIKLPFEFGGPAEFVGGLFYVPTFNVLSASLTDQAGATQTVNGYGSSTITATHTATLTSGSSFVATNDYRQDIYETTTVSDSSSHVISLPVSANFKPSESVSFAVGVKPVFTIGSTATSHAKLTHTVTTVSDGDAVPAATDTDDYVDTTDDVDQPYATTSLRTAFGLEFNTGVQLFVIPKVLRLNIGAGASFTPVDRTETHTTYTGLATSTTTRVRAGVTTTTASTAGTTVGDEFTVTTKDAGISNVVNYEVGLTLFANENISFDFIMANNAALNLTDTSNVGGFFDLTNYKILMTIQLPNAGTK